MDITGVFWNLQQNGDKKELSIKLDRSFRLISVRRLSSRYLKALK